MRPSPRGARAALLLAASAAAALAQPARAQDGQGTQQRYVTIGARSCPSYADITANRARNNIMESLQDLGVDTPYGVNGVPLLVDPVLEASVQPDCTPIANWRFTLGTGIQGRAVSGVWGLLSKVTGEFADPGITTEASVPLRDGAGDPIPGATIGGATTIRLTDQQRDLSASPSKLWIQGGTPTLPITDPVTYGFGALRCATDNLNGDNVEWISYAPDTVHVFCFAYYVKPAPTSGTIRIVKEVSLPPDSFPQRVRFTGDLSYNPGGEFFLTASNGNPGSQSFIRAAGRTWTVTEESTGPLGRLDSLVCVSAKGSSMSATDIPTRTAAITLGAGDTVTCTYANTFRPPPSGLTLRKVSNGAVGTFGFDVRSDVDAVPDAAATTREDGIAAIVEPADTIGFLREDTYEVTEDPPADVGGTWRLARVNCVPGGLSPIDAWRTEITVARGTACTFFNTFRHAGAITLRKVTLRGTATTRFQVRAESGARRPEYEQIATTTSEAESVRATGDDLEGIPIGAYSIQETIGGPNRWEVASVLCDGRPVPAVGGRIVVELTDGNPAKDCAFVNRRIPPVTPPDPPAPPVGPPGPPVEVPPAGGIAGEEVAGPVANLVVRKRVQPRRVLLGGDVRYLITVVNRGPDPSRDVTLSEPGVTPHGGALALRTEDGSCRNRPPRYCRFGTLAPGERATLRVRVRTEQTGRFVNRVAVNSSTAQRSLLGKRARARVRVLARQVPRFTG
jgi:hypothetical protein